MNKSDLIVKMTERLGGDRSAAVAAVNGVLEEIEGGVARGERVSLTGFGTFERRERAPRTGRNPRTGEAIQVGSSVIPVFRAGTGFRSLLGSDGGSASSGSAADTVAVAAEAAAGKRKSGKEARQEGEEGRQGGEGQGKKAKR